MQRVERGLTVSASATTEPHLLSSLIDTWLRVALSCCLGMNVLDASPIHSSRNLRKQQQHNELEGLGDQSRTVKQVKDDTAPASGANGLEQVLNLECLEDCQGGLTSSGSSSHSGSSIASDSSTRSASSSGGSSSTTASNESASKGAASFWWPWSKPAQQPAQPKSRFPSVAPPKPFRIYMHDADSPEVRARVRSPNPPAPPVLFSSIRMPRRCALAPIFLFLPSTLTEGSHRLLLLSSPLLPYP